MSALLNDAVLAGFVLTAPPGPARTAEAAAAAAPAPVRVLPPAPAPVPAPTVESTPMSPLLVRDDVWRGRARMRGARGEPTGHPALDALLPDGGWPRGALTEILHARDGVGELQLVLPTLAALTRRGERVAWIAPPYEPCAVALAQRGVVLERLVVLRPRASRKPCGPSSSACVRVRSARCSRGRAASTRRSSGG